MHVNVIYTWPSHPEGDIAGSQENYANNPAQNDVRLKSTQKCATASKRGNAKENRMVWARQHKGRYDDISQFRSGAV